MRTKSWSRCTAMFIAAVVAISGPVTVAAESATSSSKVNSRAANNKVNSDLSQMPAHSDVMKMVSGKGARADVLADPIGSLDQQQPAPQQESRSVLSNKQSTYSMAQLNAMPYDQLTELLMSIEWTQMPELFKYNDDVQRFYEDEARFQAIVDQLAASGASFTAEDEKGITTLVEVLRSGYYLGFYNDGLSKLNTTAYREKVMPAITAITQNSAFTWGTDVQNKVIGSTGKMISNSTVDVDTINHLAEVVKQFVDRVDVLANDNAASNSYFSLIDGVGYNLMWRMDDKSREASFKGAIDAYLDQFFRLAQNGPRSQDHVWLTNNAIYFTGALGHYYSDPMQANRILTDVMQKDSALSELYFEAAAQIEQHYARVDANGNQVNMDALKQAGKEKYLSKQTVFDEGKVVFKTGGNLSDDQIQRLYWAAKEVQAQFFRVTGHDKALEPGNVDDVLTVVIYNNPDEYRMNKYLYGYETNNGGIYIEGDGTFFTYDRTAEQSIYSLEELFRHEVTHYLQGRYGVPGGWGQGQLYDGGRMPWFEEGGAEFFAGATRLEGIKPRKSVVSNIKYDRGTRFTVSDTVNSKYGTWNFYNYSFALYDYLYQNDMMQLDRIHTAIRSGNAEAYSEQLNYLSINAHTNEAYQRSIADHVAQFDSMTVPLVSDDYMSPLAPKSASSIYDEITRVARISDVVTQEKKSAFFNTFELRGTYTGTMSTGKTDDWKVMSELADGFLRTLSEQPWNGYKTVTAYFTNYRVDNEGRFVYDVVFHGKLPDGEGTGQQPDDGDKDGSGENGNNGGQDGNGNGSDNGSGEEDGNSGQQPDDKQVNVDAEPNNKPEEAVVVDGSGKVVSGKVNDEDYMDIYRFEVSKEEDWSIELEAANQDGLAWIVYHESDMANFAGYPTQVEGNRLTGSVSARSGTYYVFVYKIGAGEQPYQLKVKAASSPDGETKPDKELEPLVESEPNDTPDSVSNPLPMNRTTLGALEGTDTQDIFLVTVDKPSDLRIELEKQAGEGVNWMLFKEGDLERPVVYPLELEGRGMNASYEAEPGQYLLYVYKFANEDIRYKLHVR
ncbi:collagenase [Paenibacillus agilis]|uniref:microbial collagenase n=1 Tax=Paenibacillus agilis TaxID=3020863 RepID=A0A559II24_9BACL|nr:collagenase [Paenibacillus agilis]TVX87160.1 collagenase [Paenibacillus agilis]